MCVCVCKVSWATVVESDPKAPFLIATTPKCRRVLLLSLYIYIYMVATSVKQGYSKWIELSVAVKRIYVNKNKYDT